MLLHLFYHVCVNFSPNEYDKIAALNIDLSKKYQRDRDTNNAPDNVINNLISFEPSYINKLLAGIKNINDKALLAVYALTPPRRIMDYQLMKITHRTDIERLDKKFKWVIFENELPSLFVFLNHKTKKSQPEPKITIPTDLATILYTYVNSNLPIFSINGQGINVTATNSIFASILFTSNTILTTVILGFPYYFQNPLSNNITAPANYNIYYDTYLCMYFPYVNHKSSSVNLGQISFKIPYNGYQNSIFSKSHPASSRANATKALFSIISFSLQLS